MNKIASNTIYGVKTIKENNLLEMTLHNSRPPLFQVIFWKIIHLLNKLA